MARTADVDDDESSRTPATAEELRRRLADAEQRVAAVAGSTGDPVLMLGGDGRIGTVNPAAEAVLGRSADELSSVPFTSLVHEGDGETVARLLARTRAGAPASGACRLDRPDGSTVAGRLVLTPVEREGGHDDGAVVVVRDVARELRDRERIERLALVDPLTGLPNRTLFVDRLRHASDRLRRRPVELGLVLCDIDAFRLVNVSLGHAAGDRLLAAVGERVRAAVRPHDTVARLGGDEFGVLCEDLTGARDALAAAERIRRAVDAPFDVDGRNVFVTMSLGVVHTAAYAAPGDLLSAADVALHTAKQHGGARTELYDESLRRAGRRALDRATRLRQAVDRDELAVHYQPIVDLEHRTAVGVEALLRWQQPGGLAAAEEFVDVAEESGALVELLGRTAAAAARVVAAQPDEPYLALDLSPRQLADPGTAAALVDALAAAGLPATRVTVEVTEAGIAREPQVALETLRAVRETGARVAIDRFGADLSSPLHLRLITPDQVKIARELVQAADRGATELAIASSVVSLARAVGATPVALGVETPAQAETLRRLGCRLAQGRMWSAPVPESELAPVLAGLRSSRTRRNPTPAVETGDPAVVARAMALYQGGASYHTIAAALNAEGLRTPKGARWHPRTVARLITGGDLR